jgi:putative transposase
VRALVCRLWAERAKPGRDDGWRGIEVDHSTVHRWAIKLLPVLEKVFRRRKRPVGKSWRVDETYIKVKGKWKYLYRAVDKAGETVDFLLRAHRDKAAAQRYFEKSIDQNGEPETITIDKSGSNLAALEALNAQRDTPIKICQRRRQFHVKRTVLNSPWRDDQVVGSGSLWSFMR